LFLTHQPDVVSVTQQMLPRVPGLDLTFGR
jgi:hypothetical protein